MAMTAMTGSHVLDIRVRGTNHLLQSQQAPLALPSKGEAYREEDAATHAGAATTNAATHAGTWSTMVAGGAGLIAGIFLGLAFNRK